MLACEGGHEAAAELLAERTAQAGLIDVQVREEGGVGVVRQRGGGMGGG